MNKLLIPLLASAVSYGSVIQADDIVDRIRTSDGAECYQQNNTGQEVTTGVRLRADTLTDRVEPEIYLEFKFDVGRKKLEKNRIDCKPMSELEQVRIKLDNEKLKLEVDLLRSQLEKQNNKNKPESLDNW